MPPRCAYTHRSGPDLVELTVPSDDPLARILGQTTFHVLPSHREALVAFGRRAERFGTAFTASMVLGCLGLLGFGFVGWTTAAGASVAAMGAIALVLPFCTPQTVQMFGVRASLLTARIAGLVLVGLGVVIAVF